MIDHAPRINAQRQAERESAEMAELEKRSAPIQWGVVLFVVAVILLSFAAGLLRGHFEHYADLAANNEALVQCLNGHLIKIDNVLVQCDTHPVDLVAQVQP